MRRDIAAWGWGSGEPPSQLKDPNFIYFILMKPWIPLNNSTGTYERHNYIAIKTAIVLITQSMNISTNIFWEGKLALGSGEITGLPSSAYETMTTKTDSFKLIKLQSSNHLLLHRTCKNTLSKRQHKSAYIMSSYLKRWFLSIADSIT